MHRVMAAYLLLRGGELLPLGPKELADLAERDIGVLRLDAVSVVLDEEHVCREGTAAR